MTRADSSALQKCAFLTRESKRILKEQEPKGKKKKHSFWCVSFSTDPKVVTKDTEMPKFRK